MPHIISESGRALTAHHALLLIKVIDVESQAERPVPELTEDDHPLLHEMLADYRDASRKNVSQRRVREVFHDVTFDKERAQELFNSGVLSLRERAMAEQIYFATVNASARDRRSRTATSSRTSSPISTRRSSTATSATSRSSSRCRTAGRSISSSRSCRFTGWTRSRRAAARSRTSPATPTARSTASSATRTGNPSLELHEFRDGEPYMLGIFLTGAYQEILGDLHNLFGDTNAVHIRLASNGGYEVTDLVHGDTVTEVLNYVQFRASDLLQTFRRKVTAAKHISRAGGEHVHRRLRRGPRGLHVPRGRGGAVATSCRSGTRGTNRASPTRRS